MTSDKTTLINSLQQIYSSGGTNFNNAINRSISAFIPEDINTMNTNNRIIFLSAGESSASTQYCNLLKAKI